MILPIFFNFGICNVILNKLYPFPLLLMLQGSELKSVLNQISVWQLEFLPLNQVSKPANGRFQFPVPSYHPALLPPPARHSLR